MQMTPAALLKFLNSQRFGVQASVSAASSPQAAVVGLAFTDQFEAIFDTLDPTRKAINLKQNPKIALVIGGLVPGDERTVQYEGVADLPTGLELERLRAIYYERFPDGPQRLSWPGLVYVRVRPTWIRYSDFNQDPPLIVEFDQKALGQAEAPPPDLWQAFEATDYRVSDYPHDFVIRIGQPCKPLEALLWDYSLPSAIFITAYNPQSQRRSPAENQAAQARLRQRLKELHATAVLEGAGIDPMGAWPAEPSFLALGLSLDEGIQLSKEFGQKAFVYVGAGNVPELVFP
jgi:hypothetical protein